MLPIYKPLNIHNVYMPICETTYTQKVEHTYFIAPDTELFVQRVENGNVQLSKHLSCLFDSLCKSYTSYVSGKLQLHIPYRQKDPLYLLNELTTP